jgi:hypothetical protein
VTDNDLKIEELLANFNLKNPHLTELLTELRKRVNKAAPELEETVKYGGLVFLRDGELLGGLFLYKAFVTMEFSFGNALKDEDKLLEGKGKLRRNLKFSEQQDIEDKRAEYFIGQAFAQ